MTAAISAAEYPGLPRLCRVLAGGHRGPLAPGTARYSRCPLPLLTDAVTSVSPLPVLYCIVLNCTAQRVPAAWCPGVPLALAAPHQEPAVRQPAQRRHGPPTRRRHRQQLAQAEHGRAQG